MLASTPYDLMGPSIIQSLLGVGIKLKGYIIDPVGIFYTSFAQDSNFKNNYKKCSKYNNGCYKPKQYL
jgi:hypothetical protein